MKYVICFFLALPSVAVLAQQETYDLVTCTLPGKDWKRETGNSYVSFTNVNKKTKKWCQLVVYKSTASKGSIEADFDSEWQELAAKPFNVAGDPQKSETQEIDGWKVVVGVAGANVEGGNMMIMHTVASGYNTCISVMAKTNSEDYTKAIEDFTGSIVLKKPVTTITSQNNQATDNSAIVKGLAQNVWARHQNRNDWYGLGTNNGYSKAIYKFTLNGKYTYSIEAFKYDTPKYYMVDEEGTYTIQGNSITLKPTKSTWHTHQMKKTDPILKSGSFASETAEYSLDFRVIADQLRIVLAPTSGKETKRDGVFNYMSEGVMQKAYIYGVIDEKTGHIIYAK